MIIVYDLLGYIDENPTFWKYAISYSTSRRIRLGTIIKSKILNLRCNCFYFSAETVLNKMNEQKSTKC
jgi:hypothetical protein